MAKKARNLITRLASRELLEQAADYAYGALDDKNVWYARRFIANREDYIDRIQNMIILGEYPTKEYHCVIHHAVDKDREIFPLPFFPWSILFHAVKLLLEPIAERILILDTSAGREGKGQVFGALRTERLIRRSGCRFVVQADLRKYYLAMPHSTLRASLRRYIDDEMFMDMVEKTILDFRSDIEDLLDAERAKKELYCASWRSTEEIPDDLLHCARGITVGLCIAQIFGNIVPAEVDRAMKEKYRVKVYHRHCDDIFMGADTIEQARYFLNRLDYEMNQRGLTVKASSFIAPLKDEKRDIKGRTLDYVGYVFSRGNMRVRKRSKVRFARLLHRVKSRKRRHEILASYWGILKWGRCRHLWNVLTNNNSMGFSDFGISVKEVSEKDGHRYFHVPQVTASEILNLTISVVDFEDGLTIQGKSDRCAVIFEVDGIRKKFITSSTIIRDQLNSARDLEKKGQKVFPVQTSPHRKALGGGKNTYFMD